MWPTLGMITVSRPKPGYEASSGPVLPVPLELPELPL